MFVIEFYGSRKNFCFWRSKKKELKTKIMTKTVNSDVKKSETLYDVVFFQPTTPTHVFFENKKELRRSE